MRPSLGQIERGEGAVSVEARSMQVLLCLARHAPHVVSKQRLFQEIWGDAFVTDEVLSHAIWELRKALGDEARSPRFIQTLAKKGYRLVSEVTFQRAPEPLASGTVVGRYEIVAPVGGGAMGEVYRAKDRQLERAVALKFLPSDLTRDPEARKRFLREARAAASIDHPNVATLYEVGETEGGRVYLAMPFYDGQTLEEKLAAAGSLPPEEAIAIARQIALGLAAAHQKDIVHRDVKPANVILLPDGTVKLLDFGLAKLAGATTLTRLGASPGTPAYKSPEQTKGEKVDPRSDVWALGVVLYRMLTGRVPFGGEYEQAVIYAILHEAPRPLGEGFPVGLGAILEKALAKEPEARYASVAALAGELESIGRGAESSASPVAAPRVARPRHRWRKVILGGAGVLALTLVISALWVWWWKKHRWDLPPQAAQLLLRAEEIEWRGDTPRILANAEERYKQALALAPDHPEIQASLASLLIRETRQFPGLPNRRSEIRDLVNKARDQAPGLPMPWVALAELHLLEGKNAQAEQAARKAIHCDPKFDRGYTLYGVVLIREGRPERGFDELRKAVEVGGRESDGRGYLRAKLFLANEYYDTGQYDYASNEYMEILKLDADQTTANLNLGAVYLRNGRYDDAQPLLKKAAEADDTAALNNLGVLYSNIDQCQDAIKIYQRAVALDPRLPSPLHGLGDCYQRMGDLQNAGRWYELAIARYDEALKQRPSASTLSRRAFCAARLGRKNEALKDIERAVRQARPDDGDVFLEAAAVYGITGPPNVFYAYVRKALEKGTSLAEFRRDLSFRDFQGDPEFRAILDDPRPKAGRSGQSDLGLPHP